MAFKKSKYNKKADSKPRLMAHETNPDLQPPDYPEGHVETIDEFIARGGKITIVPPYEAPLYGSMDAMPKKK